MRPHTWNARATRPAAPKGRPGVGQEPGRATEGAPFASPRRARRLRLRNRLLLALSESDRAAVLAAADLVPIAVGSIIQESHRKATHAYFPNSGLGSVVAVMEDGSMIEGASVGMDGFIGSTLVLGAHDSSARVIWQVPGEAYRIPADDFERAISEGRFGNGLMIYIQEMLDQTTQVAGCNRRHPIIARAARWLLMTHDRVDGDEFVLTQEFLATMLGVNRPKVTLAAQRLQADGQITYHRGRVTILDRAGLESVACECYRILAERFPGTA